MLPEVEAAAPATTRPPRPVRRLVVLAAVALAAVALFLTVGVTGGWDYVLPRRATTVAGLVLVGYAIAVSTVLFQTVTHNRILTPSIMGFDALYVLIQTVSVFALGAAAATALDVTARFAVEVVVMVALSALLYRWLFTGGGRSLHLLVLVGVVLGVFFRSVSGFLQRLMDPNEFVVLQDRFFASFTAIDSTLLAVSAVVVLLVSLAGWRIADTFDVLTLGRDAAVSLGVPYRSVVTTVLVLVAVLVSVSTALVGPVTFFGLLVANLAYHLAGSHQHRYVLPVAALLAAIALVGGQAVLQQVLDFDTSLSIIIEFVGGLAFLALLLRGTAASGMPR